MRSARCDPPGSRVVTTAMPRASRRRARRSIWVDFPAPSPPSKVMKRPVIRRVAAAERAAHEPGAELEQPVDGPPLQVALADVLAGVERQVERLHVAARDPQARDLGACGDRRLQRAGVDDARRDPLAGAARDEQPDRLLRHERDRAAAAAEDLGLADHLALVEQQPRLEGAEAPFEELAGLVLAVARGLQPVHDKDQPLAVLHRRGDKADSPIRRCCRSSARRRRCRT